MFVGSISSEDGGFTRVTFGGIDGQNSTYPEWRRPHVLSEQADRRIPAAHGFMARVLSAPDTLVYSVRTEMYAQMGQVLLGNAHDVICTTYGPQPLEFQGEGGASMIREADGSVREAEPADALVEELQLVAS